MELLTRIESLILHPDNPSVSANPVERADKAEMPHDGSPGEEKLG
ncbi:hypothetical protein [Bradyrhizobium guangdongense]|nr:hypothetical protein [Bradyrhizobium guangdongense]